MRPARARRRSFGSSIQIVSLYGLLGTCQSTLDAILLLGLDIDQRLWCGSAQNGGGVIGGEGFHLGRNVHGTEFGPAHRAEMRVLEAVLGEGFVVHAARGFGV